MRRAYARGVRVRGQRDLRGLVGIGFAKGTFSNRILRAIDRRLGERG